MQLNPTLWIGNLPVSCTNNTLKTLFTEFGEPRRHQVVTDGYAETFGFIEFVDAMSADLAFHLKHGFIVEGHCLRIECRASLFSNLRICGLLVLWQEKDVHIFFNMCGTVVRSHVVRTVCNRHLLRTRSAIVPYQDVSTTAIAMQTLQGHVIAGRALRVRFAKACHGPWAPKPILHGWRCRGDSR